MADLPFELLPFDIEYNQPVRVSPLVARITANNPGPLTGKGTNTYVVGQSDYSIIDPGPADTLHVDAILRATSGDIARIFATHNHEDHSPAAALLAKETGAELMGLIPDPNYEHTDLSFQPKRSLLDGEVIHGKDHLLTVIYTPGHLKQHFCLLLDQEQCLFAGDHVMQGATVTMIQAHGGNLLDYMQSIRKLQHYSLKTIAPAHGHLLKNPEEVLRLLYDHRMERESQIVAVLREYTDITTGELVSHVYPDLPENLRIPAQLSIDTHLRKLELEGRAKSYHEGHWLLEAHRWSLT